IKYWLILLVAPLILPSCKNKEEKNLPNNFDYGRYENGVYSNKFFDLEVFIDPNWSVQTTEQLDNLMKRGQRVIAGDDDNLKAAIDAADVNVASLFAAFKHGIGSPETVNPSIMIVAENVSSYSGIKNGEDYLKKAKQLLNQGQFHVEFSDEIVQQKIGSVYFYKLEANMSILDKTITQELYAALIHGFCLSIAVSYNNESSREEVHEILENIKIEL